MQDMEALKKISEDEGISFYKASQSLGKSPNYLSNTTARGSHPRTDIYAGMLRAFGWELRAVKQGTAEDIGYRID